MGLKFSNRKALFEEVRRFEGPLSPKEVQAISFLLDCIENDPYISNIHWAAYMLATTKHETANTYKPIHEYGSHARFVRLYGGQTSLGKRLGNDTPEEGAIYAGQGYVQLTGESNYERAEIALKTQYPNIVAEFERRTGRPFDLTVGDQPNDSQDAKNAQDPAIAYVIMSYGMRTGMFTTKRLSDYTSQGGFDAKNARKIINGMDKADTIALYYGYWLRALLAGVRPPPQPQGSEDILEVPGTEGPAPATTPDSPKDSEPTNQVNGASEAPLKVAIEKPEKQGFLSGLWKRITVLLGGNVGFETVTSKAQQVGALGLTSETWVKIGYLALAASIILLLAYAWDYWNDYKRNKQITQDLIEANFTPNNTVQLIDPDMVDLYRSRGYKVITR